MGYLGFLFNIENEQNFNDKIYFNKKEIKNNFLVIFVEIKNLEGNFILGKEHFFKEELCEFFFLNKYHDFEEFLVFEKSLFKYSKISIFEKKSVDYKYLTFWFDAKNYKKIYESLTLKFPIKNLENKVKDNTLNILKILK